MPARTCKVVHNRPWFFDGEDDLGAFVVHVAEGEVAEVFAEWNTPKEAAANAHLIAAAPDMLVALEIALRGVEAYADALGRGGNASDAKMTNDDADLIRAAIAKARGETP